ncbi:ABC transporter permease [Flocculibacter collagenilyticus]|uniref:ABC transporter permease n=1 Tax=Flocculibacter collagenilyticus TaxID=2744479 RepID=UPI0018F573CE|nr:ABC transporter permease [Flocculibacter collagenilyticus]
MLNDASKQQYASASDLLSPPFAFYIYPKEGLKATKQDFRLIRQLGFIEVSPVLEVNTILNNDTVLAIYATDLLALSILYPDVFNVNMASITQTLAQQLSIEHQQTSYLQLKSGEKLPYRIITDANLRKHDMAIIDFSLAWQLFKPINAFSYFTVTAMSAERKQTLANQLPSHLMLYEPWKLEEKKGFANALHLNLTALALLGFLVSLFIAYQAGQQAWQYRHQLINQLRLLGVPLVTIRIALLIECAFIVVFACGLGILLAAAIVIFSLPIVGVTLSQIYDLHLTGHFEWHWRYLLWAFLLSSSAVITALFHQLRLINRPQLKSIPMKSQRSANVLFIGRLVLITLFFLFLHWLMPLSWSESFLSHGFSSEVQLSNWLLIMMKYGFLLLASIAFLPIFLLALITAFHSLLLIFNHLNSSWNNFKIGYLIKDAQNQIYRRYVPLAAFYLALTASISAGLMVKSFNTAFVDYLDQQLSQDFIISVPKNQSSRSIPQPSSLDENRLEAWLKQQAFIEEVILYQHAWFTYKNTQLRIARMKSINQFNALSFKALKVEAEFVQAQLDKNNNNIPICFINEQFALSNAIELSKPKIYRIFLSQAQQTIECEVKGVYFQYGYLGHSAYLVKTNHHQINWRGTSYGIYLKASESITSLALQQRINNALNNPSNTQSNIQPNIRLISESILQSSELKKLALEVFDQTFILTQATSAVLLGIACFGLFLSVTSLELARKPDLLALYRLGYSKRNVFSHMFVQWMLLLIGTVLLSWPVATVIAEVLVSKVLPASFGWSMPLVNDVGTLLMTMLSSSSIGIILVIPALFIPLYSFHKKLR